MFSFLPLMEKILSSILNFLPAMVINLEALDNFPLSIAACDWEREDKTLWYSIWIIVRVNCHSCPSTRAIDPVSDMLNSCMAC